MSASWLARRPDRRDARPEDGSGGIDRRFDDIDRRFEEQTELLTGRIDLVAADLRKVLAEGLVHQMRVTWFAFLSMMVALAGILVAAEVALRP